MELQLHGANCITINTKQIRLVIDDNLESLGGQAVTKAGDVVLFTSAQGDPSSSARLIVDHPGEYEIAGVAIYGFPVRSHMDEQGKKSATMYKIVVGESSLLIAGHIYPELTDAQLEMIGMVDVLLVPVGGNGYTLDGVGALKLIKKIDPKLVIPTHYDNPALKYPVAQQSLDEALKVIGMEPKDTVEKFKLRTSDLETTTHLVVLNQG